jgi:hypothetical protein
MKTALNTTENMLLATNIEFSLWNLIENNVYESILAPKYTSAFILQLTIA